MSTTGCALSKTFKDALREEQDCVSDYDRKTWLYLPCNDADYRYVLGTRGKRPVICMGVNPSTATPNRPDPTLRKVEHIAKANGYDSFIMVNLCAQRATTPADLDVGFHARLHQENLYAIQWVLEQVGDSPAVWAAWGTGVDARDYLTDCLREIVLLAQRFSVRWYRVGERSKDKGHPRHPLYEKSDSPLIPFQDIQEYVQRL